MKQDKGPESKKTQAVAIGYDEKSMNAPLVMASGQGYQAERIIEAAKEFNIPVEHDPVLAQALGQLGLGQEIPTELYRVIAEILVFIMETDKKVVSG